MFVNKLCKHSDYPMKIEFTNVLYDKEQCKDKYEFAQK
jgi:hypothetical protein